VRFFKDHLQRLTEGMKVLGMNIPFYFNEMEDRAGVFIKNNDMKNGSLRWQVWRKNGGSYNPVSNFTEDIVVFQEYGEVPKEIRLGISNRSLVSFGPVSKFKTCNALPYILAGIEMGSTSFNDMILLNNEGAIAECIASNIFWHTDNHYFTPSIATGCVEGVMRKHVIQTMRKLKLPISEGEFGIEYFLNANKIFLTNSRGIYPVLSIGDMKLNNDLKLPHELERLRVF